MDGWKELKTTCYVYHESSRLLTGTTFFHLFFRLRTVNFEIVDLW